MTWVTSNLLPLGIVAMVLIVGSFARFDFEARKPNKLAMGGGLALLLLVLIGVYQVTFGTPGQEDVVDEDRTDIVVPDLESTALERLRKSWDSEDVANWPAAETLAQLSDIAYQPPHEAITSFAALGFDQTMPVVQGSMIGYVVSGEDVTVIVFRGTDFTEVSDWLANIGRSATDTPHGAVHSGFFNAYQSMKGQVDAILEERDASHLWVTGHSLGGALALMCAYDLEANEDRQLDGLITFGQPMAARQEFAEYVDDLMIGRYARFVNRDDIVPRVPPSHVACGSLVWITDSGVKRSKKKRVVYGAPTGSESGVPTASPEAVEIKPMDDSEFEALQQNLKAQQNAEVQRLPDGTPIVAYQSSSLIDDHSMWLYLDEIRKLFGIDASNERQEGTE